MYQIITQNWQLHLIYKASAKGVLYYNILSITTKSVSIFA